MLHSGPLRRAEHRSNRSKASLGADAPIDDNGGMTGATFLTRVVIENYKSIAACDVRLGPLTFLIGPNGAGKSNFLDALQFVNDALVHSLDYAVRQRGGIHYICHHSRGPSAQLVLRLEFMVSPQIEGTYSFRIGLVKDNGSWRWEVLEEECRIGLEFFHLKSGQVTSSSGTAPAPARDRLYLVRASGASPFREVFDALSDMQFYHLQPRSIPDIDSYDPQERLRPDGSNLTSTLAVLQYGDRDAKERIEEFLRVVLPTLRQVRIEPVTVEHHPGESSQETGNGQKIALVFAQGIGNSIALFGPTQMSEGTLRTLAILTALYQIDPYQKRRPTLTAIEDIEAAIHPAELGVLFDALDEASLTGQVVVTSQSPDLLDNKELDADSILAVSAEDGVTRIGPLDEACRTALLEHQATAGELLRIGQIAPGNTAPPAVTASPR